MIEQQHTDIPLYFVDETMYTVNDRLDRVWAPQGDMVCLKPNKDRFDAIAALAAIDREGNVTHSLIKHRSVKKDDFVQFLDELADITQGPSIVFLDNLVVHKTKVVLEAAARNQQTFIFNGAYTSELNPIEHLWQHAKHGFRRDLIKRSNYKNSQAMFNLVYDSIYRTRPGLLKIYIDSCFRKMREYLNALPHNVNYPQLAPGQ